MENKKLTVLIDLTYSDSINRFEEEFGENIDYNEIEQESYTELKEMLNDTVKKKLKFRKETKGAHFLTVKSYMTEHDYETIKKELLKNDKNELNLDFLYDFKAYNLRLKQNSK